MKTICLYFEIHQANHLKRYRFFDIGTDHYYYDDYENERAITETAQRSYIPALRTMLEMTQTYGKFFRVAFSVSGVVLELMEQYTPEVIDAGRRGLSPYDVSPAMVEEIRKIKARMDQ